MKLEPLLQYMDGYLSVPGHPDYPEALNGLQVGGPEEVRHLIAAVDASEASIGASVDRGADLMIVHHGLFWEGLRPLTERRLRRVKLLIGHDVALYSCHLPLDGHPEVGNAALLSRALGLRLEGRLGSFQGAAVGWHGRSAETLDLRGLTSLAQRALGGLVHVIAGGPKRIERVGVVTGSGASFIEEAAGLGLDALLTGEGSHHAHLDAMELGIHLLLGGHYATETFGVQALAAHLSDRFGLTWDFVDLPTGL